jgi:hypothetical protein
MPTAAPEAHSTPAELVARAGDALALARSADTPEALDDLHRALLALGGAFEVTDPADLGTVATWYALDAAAAVWDAARREAAMADGHRDPVRYAPRLLPLEAARHAVMAARAALGGAA